MFLREYGVNPLWICTPCDDSLSNHHTHPSGSAPFSRSRNVAALRPWVWPYATRSLEIPRRPLFSSAISIGHTVRNVYRKHSLSLTPEVMPSLLNKLCPTHVDFLPGPPWWSLFSRLLLVPTMFNSFPSMNGGFLK